MYFYDRWWKCRREALRKDNLSYDSTAVNTLCTASTKHQKLKSFTVWDPKHSTDTFPPTVHRARLAPAAL